VLDGLGAILGAIFVGILLDKLPFGRKVRGYIGVGTVFLLGIMVWGGGLAFQLDVSQDCLLGPNILLTNRVD
jgi:uncharacterized membrane protein YczE